MTDVTSQLEANGLPTRFESSSTQPDVSHTTVNAGATISNAEASQIKQDAPGLDIATVAKPVQPVESVVTEPPQRPPEPAPAGRDISLDEHNGVSSEPAQSQVNGHTAEAEPGRIDSQAVESSFVDSGLAGSMQSEHLPSNTIAEGSLLQEPVTHSAPLPDQAPTSDLRTSPHSDNLPPTVVASIEAEKHEMDNNADQMSEPAPAPVVEEADVPMTQPEEPVTAAPAPILPSPPPEHAPSTLPTDSQSHPIVHSIEPPSASDPIERPAEIAPSPAAKVAEALQDHEMMDAPATVPLPSVKPVREREDDLADEPAAKRLKTDEDIEEKPATEPFPTQSPAAPTFAADTAAQAAPAAPAPPTDADDEVTPARLSHMKKVVSNLKKSNASAAFRLPVDYVALNIPNYPQVITKPMDLGTIDTRLKNNQYTSVQAFKDDFYQIIINCETFNGPEHAVTQAGKKMESSFNNQMANLPPASLVEPTRAEKKAAKPKLEPVRAPPPRRQSLTAKGASPKAASPATFAPDPNGMPLIRRDSALDGRPKRAIVPPKRNSDFGGARPKKKKYELELRFCDEVLKIISSPKHWAVNQYFTHPVDPVALNIPTYFQIIKKPMDLATVRQKLDNGMYEKAKDFEEDVRLVFKNCYKFNPEGDYVYQRGQELEKLFSQEWAKKQDWIAAREPDSEPASVEGDEEEDESDEEAESEVEDQSDQLSKLQAQLEAIQSQMGQLKSKNKSPGASKKKDKKKTKKDQPATKFPGLQKDKNKKPAKKTAKPEKDRYVTFAEKQYISNGIAMLPERPMQEALKIIQNSVPALANSDSGEIELDIEEVPNHALLKLLSFVKKYAGPPPEEPKEPEYPSSTTTTKKKSKSMSKHEQEAHIAELKGAIHSHDKASSPDAMQSIETGAEDSDDDSNEESEEE